MDDKRDGCILKLFDFHGEVLRLNQTHLHRFLRSVRDLPVLVLSVAGAFRGGKSFLLNVIKCFLQQDCKPGWFEDDGAHVAGFPSRKSWSTVTTGVDIWSEPCIVTTSSGEKVAVMLMDTQGINDNAISPAQFTRVFSLSTLLSDIQIFNIRDTIGQDSLEQLQYFHEFGKHSVQSAEKQKKLILLVRDWDGSTLFGFEEGRRYLSKIIPQSEMQKILGNFMEVKCFLMPRPGDKMLKHDEFTGPISDLNVNFRLNATLLVESALHRDVKAARKGFELEEWCEQLAQAFEHEDLPDPISLVEMEAERMYMSAGQRALAEFTHIMDCQLDALSCCEFDSVSRKASSTATELYQKRKSGFEVKKLRDEFLKKLQIQLVIRSADYKSKNQLRVEEHNQSAIAFSVGRYVEHMKSACVTCLEEEQFDKHHERFLNRASRYLQSSVIDTNAKIEEEFQALVSVEFKNFISQNQMKLTERSFYSAISLYNSEMAFALENPQAEDDFQCTHLHFAELATSVFEQTAPHSSTNTKEWLDKVMVAIEDSKNVFLNSNHERILLMMKHDVQRESDQVECQRQKNIIIEKHKQRQEEFDAQLASIINEHEVIMHRMQYAHEGEMQSLALTASIQEQEMESIQQEQEQLLATLQQLLT